MAAASRVHVTRVQRSAEWARADRDGRLGVGRRGRRRASGWRRAGCRSLRRRRRCSCRGRRRFQAVRWRRSTAGSPSRRRSVAGMLARCSPPRAAPSSGARRGGGAPPTRGGGMAAVWRGLRRAAALQGGDGCEHQRAIAAWCVREAERRRYVHRVKCDQWRSTARPRVGRGAGVIARAVADLRTGWRALSAAAAVTIGGQA